MLRKQLVRAALTPGTLYLVRVYVAVQAERARMIFLTLGNVPQSIMRAGALEEGPSCFLMIPFLKLIIITLLVPTLLQSMLSGPTIISFALWLTVEIPF